MKENIYSGGLLYGNVNKAVRRGEFPLHHHSMAELYVCLGGSATDEVDGTENTVLPGDVYVHPKDVMHKQRNMTDFRCCVFQFDMERLKKRADLLELSKNPGFITLFDEDIKEKRSKANMFVDANTIRFVEQTADIMKSEENSDILDILFVSLVSVICSKCRRRVGGDKSNINGNISAVASYIEKNYGENITLQILSEMSHYSRRHFTRLFCEAYGESPMEYLDRVRIKNACDLLIMTRYSIIQISEMCGFEDNNLFSRHFRVRIGVSPSAYRKQNEKI